MRCSYNSKTNKEYVDLQGLKKTIQLNKVISSFCIKKKSISNLYNSAIFQHLIALKVLVFSVFFKLNYPADYNT